MRRGRWLRNLGWSLVVLTPVALGPFTLVALLKPSLIVEHWDFYVPWYGLPMTAGVILLLIDRGRNLRH